MSLEFKADHKVTVTMQETGGQPDSKEASYLSDDNKVTVQVPGGFPLVLVREGGELQGNLMGQALIFKKK
jgi:hypothetical protein